MYPILILFLGIVFSCATAAADADDQNIRRAVLDYIESQQKVNPTLMKRAVDKKLAKRTYWQSKDGSETIMETDYEAMVWVAENYNREGDKFPVSPKIVVDIFDIDNRVASVKLTVDDWIDYMHLYKSDQQQWKIINVLWQYHDTNKHVSKP